ncbi:predicted protein, partial [Nematostella vectensis]
MKNKGILIGVIWLLKCCLSRPQDHGYELCKPNLTPPFGRVKVHVLKSKGPGNSCQGCAELKNCTTFDGAIQIQGYRVSDANSAKELYFPKLTEITGHLLVSLLFNIKDLKGIFPNLAVIRGRYLFLDYALVIYQNNGLEQINLPSLTTISSGGIRIEKNINLCYVKTIRWKSIMKMNSDDPYSLVTSSNNNDCYDLCYKGECTVPAGHGASGKQYCWSSGDPSDFSCLKHYYKLESTCVLECPAGYQAKEKIDFIRWEKTKTCEACLTERCPRVCKVSSNQGNGGIIDSISSLRHYKGCTDIKGNLEIKLRGGGQTIAKELEDNLGMIERVTGYIVIRESVAIVTLKFLKNLRLIEPEKTIDVQKRRLVDVLYNDRYALTIMDNPKLEALWDFRSDLQITAGGILVRMNPRLCPGRIDPLVNDVLQWTNASLGRPVDVSQTSNGNAVACQVKAINMTVRELVKPMFSACADVCVEVSWEEVRIKEDYRNVLFYSISYRVAPDRDITEFDGVDACSATQVWTRIDVPAGDPGTVNTSVSSPGFRPVNRLSRFIGKLTPHTLYAFYVEAATLNNTGARSALMFLQTREMIPSAVVGLEASYLDPFTLLVKWQPPLYPNGNITKYLVQYQQSEYSVWRQPGIDWCIRQVLRDGDSKDGDDGKDADKNGECKVNITCNCDEEKEVDKPEKRAALFAKEFQDVLFKAIFTKTKDDNPSPTNQTTTPPTSMTFLVNGTNCTAEDQANGLCEQISTTASPTSTASDVTTESTYTTPVSNDSSTTVNTTMIPTTSIPVLEANGTEGSIRISGLKHFTDYTIQVCACTSAGCATNTRCSNTRGRTHRKEKADDLTGVVKVHVNNATRSFNISWGQPVDPNGVVLKYDVEVSYASRSSPEIVCWQGHKPSWLVREGMYGNYSVRVRAITPAGNGSWTSPVLFTIHEEKDPGGSGKLVQSSRVGVIVGSSLAACSVFILTCGIVIWFVVRKRYQEKQVPTVLYASVNPEYMNSTD